MTEVKICGLSTEETLDAALGAGASYVGFVFFPKSPRHVSLATASALVDRTRRRATAKSVALIVDAEDDFIMRIRDQVAPDMFQLHGHESVERTRDIRRLAGRPVIKALAVSTPPDVAVADAYLAPGSCADMILFDAKPRPNAALPGGNGLAFDWTILEGLEGKFPFALAGGLTPQNVAEAIRLTRAPVVDVSSGVETSPGVKSTELIRRFLHAAKTANQTA